MRLGVPCTISFALGASLVPQRVPCTFSFALGASLLPLAFLFPAAHYGPGYLALGIFSALGFGTLGGWELL